LYRFRDIITNLSKLKEVTWRWWHQFRGNLSRFR